MKKSILLAGLFLMAASCSSDESVNTVDGAESFAPVTVSVEGFSIAQGDIPVTRAATALADYSAIKFVTLAFYRSDGSEAYKHTQVKIDGTTYTTFGEFSCNLPLGSYTMVVLCNEGDNAITLSSPTSATYGEQKVMDTFAATQEVNITSNNAVSLTATLNRIITAIAVRSTDNRPNDVTQIRITYSGGDKSFNPSTGFAVNNNGFVCVLGFGSAGGSPTNIGSYLFLASDEQNVDVVVEMLNDDGDVLYRRSAENVPLKRNRVTSLTGTLFSNTGVSSSSFQVNKDWDTGYNMNF